MNEAYSIGIIGGADGPTAVFMTGNFQWEMLLICGMVILAIIWFLQKRNDKNHRRLLFGGFFTYCTAGSIPAQLQRSAHALHPAGHQSDIALPHDAPNLHIR